MMKMLNLDSPEEQARIRQEVLDSTHRALGSRSDGLEHSPVFLAECFEKRIWEQDRIFAGGTRQAPISFHDFVHKPYPVGLGSTYEAIESVIAGDRTLAGEWERLTGRKASPPAIGMRRVVEIVVPENRKRQPVEARVKSLADSIREVGLLNPIAVTPELTLVAGWHRLEAIKLLGLEEIQVRVVDLDDLRRELVEIDENLVRSELSALERSEQLQRRMEIYEALHPETRHGSAGGNAGGRGRLIANAVSASAISYACNLCTETFSRPVWHCPSCRHHWADEDDQCGNCNHKRTKRDKLTKPLGAVKTFTEDTSEKTGRSQRVIQEDVQIAKDLDEETKEAVRGTKLENSKTDLLELAREKDAEKRRELVDEVKSGKAKSVREAKSKLAPPNPEAWWSCPSCNQDFNAESAKASGWVKRGRCGACEDWADGGLEDDSSDEPSQAPIVVHPEPSTRVEQIAAAVRALTKDEVIVLWSLTRVRFEEVGVAEAR